jgi:hypothetical protein
MAATPAKPVRTRPVALGLVALAVGLLLLLPGAAHAQEVPPTTAPELLVPGDTTPTTVAGGGAPASTTTTTEPADDNRLFGDVDASTKVWIIVAGLAGVAVLIAILTVIYWRHTRPEILEPEADGAREPSRRERRKARRDRDDDPGPPAGQLDLDELMARPEPSRSVFASDPDDT